MFAIIQTDGRQIRVQVGDVLDIDLRESVKRRARLPSIRCCWPMPELPV